MRDVVIYNKDYPVFIVNTNALEYLDMITKGDIRLRRRITSILGRVSETLAEVAHIPNKGLAMRLWGYWTEQRKDELFPVLSERVFNNLFNHINAMAREKLS